MFCKYCGKPIDDDSIYCRYCGRHIVEEESIFRFPPAQSLLTRKNSKSYSFSRIRITKNQLFSIINIIWKILKTIVLVIVGLFAYLLLGLFMSPFIALFSVEIPSLGFFDEIEKIWKKDISDEGSFVE